MIRIRSRPAAILVVAFILSAMPLAAARAQTSDPMGPDGGAIDQAPVTVHYPRATARVGQQRQTAIAIKPGREVPAERDADFDGYWSNAWSDGVRQSVRPLSDTPTVNRPTLFVPNGPAQTIRPTRPFAGRHAVTHAPPPAWSIDRSHVQHPEQNRFIRPGEQQPITALRVAPAGHRYGR
jgi:hypothetical protein